MSVVVSKQQYGEVSTEIFWNRVYDSFMRFLIELNLKILQYKINLWFLEYYTLNEHIWTETSL